MDYKKKHEFVRKMGKKRLSLARGGPIQKFADGGVTYMPTTDPSLAVAGPGQGGVNQSAVNPTSGVIGDVTGLLGLNNNFVATAANLQPGTNAGQINNAYTGATNALNAQIGLTNTLTPQAAQAVANEEALSNQLAQRAAGGGPNPALAQLNQATGQNVANQAALMAGQRGAGANVGLIARQAAQQGAATQQQAVGQAATLEAQQQIAAQQEQAQLEANRVAQAGQGVTGLNTAEQNEQGILQNANTSFNNANVGMQSNINNINAQTAAANQAAKTGVLSGAINGAASAISGGVFAHGGEVKMADGGPIQPSPLVVVSSNAPQANWAEQYMSPQGASGGPDIGSPAQLPQSNVDLGADARNLGTAISKNGVPNVSGSEGYIPGETGQSYTTTTDSNGFVYSAKGGKICEGPYHGHVANYLFHDGGKVPAMVSPGEIYLSPEQVHKVVSEGANPLKIGHKFPGKAKVKGDSFKNDTIPTELEEGGVVIDKNHVMNPEKAELFVHRAIARKRVKR